MSTSVLTGLEAASYLRISTRQLERLVRDKQVPFLELPDGQVRFDLDDLADWCRTRRRGPELVPSDRMQRDLQTR